MLLLLIIIQLIFFEFRSFLKCFYSFGCINYSADVIASIDLNPKSTGENQSVSFLLRGILS